MHLIRTLAAASSTGSGGDGGWLASVTDTAVGLMDTMGAPGAGIAVALENLFPPIPSEVILPLAGFTARQGLIGLVPAILWTVAGSVVGALALYGLGAALGRERLRRVVDRMPFVDVKDLDAADVWFVRHGDLAVLIGRFIPIVRSLISIPAGVARISLPRFVLLTTIGSSVWNTVLIMLGYALATQWHVVEDVVGRYQDVVIVVIAVLIIWYVVHVIRSRRAKRDEAGDEAGGEAGTEA
jgi:membrane protein DedA with SNARE-associated domain